LFSEGANVLGERFWWRGAATERRSGITEVRLARGEEMARSLRWTSPKPAWDLGMKKSDLLRSSGDVARGG
jgi:hypothetical protein